jgi:hypothetical protein
MSARRSWAHIARDVATAIVLGLAFALVFAYGPGGALA